jgi:hypothetical protein
MPEFDQFEQPEWMPREWAIRLLGLTDDDAGYDELNELVLEFDIDVELGPIGDVIRINANDPGIKEALFSRHERQVGHRPDDPKKMAATRSAMMNTALAARDQRQADRKARLGKRIAARKRSKISRMDE